MRKFIILTYFGERKIGKYVMTKSGPLNFIQVLLTGLFGTYAPVSPALMYISVAISLTWILYFAMDFMGHGYFSMFPVTWDELDKNQQWYWGKYYNKFPLLKKPESLEKNWKTWKKLDKQFTS